MKREELIEVLRALTKRWCGPLPYRPDDILEKYADKIKSLDEAPYTKDKLLSIWAVQLSNVAAISLPEAKMFLFNFYDSVAKLEKRKNHE